MAYLDYKDIVAMISRLFKRNRKKGAVMSHYESSVEDHIQALKPPHTILSNYKDQ